MGCWFADSIKAGAATHRTLEAEYMTASDPNAVGHLRSCTAEAVHTWDGTGVCLFAKRLEDGKFRWPSVQDAVMRLSAAELSALLEGLDWKRVHAAREMPAPMQPG